MRIQQDRRCLVGFTNPRNIDSRAREAILLATALLPLIFLWGCAGVVSGKSSQPENSQLPPTYLISGTIIPIAGGSGATVALSGTANATTTADASGNFTLTGLANGTYTLTPSHPGYIFNPTSLSVTINGANITSGLDFTATAQSYSISGAISPTVGGSGATLTLSGTASATTTANASGNFTFTGLANGTYSITPSHAGYTFGPTNLSVTVNGANVTTGVDFTATAQSFSISGTISPTAGGSGATVALSGVANATTTANGSGVYTFTGLANGTYTVTPSHTGYTFSPISQNATVNGANVTGLNFTATVQTAPTFSISGTITPTAGGSGAVVTLGGAASASTTANSSGVFTFSGLPNGTYTLTPSHTGYTFSPASQNATVSGANVTGLNFTATPQTNPTYSISGTISPTAGGDLATVTLSGAANTTTIATATGNYTFTGLASGAYTVAPSNTGYTFSPANQAVSVNGANVTGVNFTATVAQSHSVVLSWVSSTSTVSGYNVYRGTLNGGPYTQVNPSLVAGLSFADSTVQNGLTYYYVATAVDASGNESAYSTPAQANVP
jgi:hypothetical protein